MAMEVRGAKPRSTTPRRPPAAEPWPGKAPGGVDGEEGSRAPETREAGAGGRGRGGAKKKVADDSDDDEWLPDVVDATASRDDRDTQLAIALAPTTLRPISLDAATCLPVKRETEPTPRAPPSPRRTRWTYPTRSCTPSSGIVSSWTRRTRSRRARRTRLSAFTTCARTRNGV